MSKKHDKLIFIPILILTIIYTLYNFLNMKNGGKKIHSSRSIVPNLCNFPDMDPWHESIIDLMEKDGTIQCGPKADAGNDQERK